MWLLVASVVALLVGPAVARLAGERRGPVAVLDGFIVAGLLGLVVLEILPEAFEHAGLVAVVAAVLGIVLPRFFEGRLHIAEGKLHGAVSWGAVIGYSLHAVLDGAALTGGAGTSALGLGVVLHRVPVGVTLWWLVRPHGPRGGMLALGLIGGATALGFAGAERLVSALPLGSLGLFQALVGGSLLHVVAGHEHGDEPRLAAPRWEALGAGLGVASLALVAWTHGDEHAHGLGHVLGHAVAVAPLALIGALLSGVASTSRARGGVRWRRLGVALEPASLAVSLALLGPRFAALQAILLTAAVLLVTPPDGAASEPRPRAIDSFERVAGQVALGAVCAGLVETACGERAIVGASAWLVPAAVALGVPLGGVAATVVAVSLAPMQSGGALLVAVLAPLVSTGAFRMDARRGGMLPPAVVALGVLGVVIGLQSLAPELLAPAPLAFGEGPFARGLGIGAGVFAVALLVRRAVLVGPKAMVARLVSGSGEAEPHAHHPHQNDLSQASEHGHSHAEHGHSHDASGHASHHRRASS